MSSQLEFTRMARTLETIATQRMTIVEPGQLTPFSFPLWAEGLRTQHVSSERWIDRVRSMSETLEHRADEMGRRA